MTIGVAPYPASLGNTYARPARFSPTGETYALRGADGMIELSAAAALAGVVSSALGGAVIGGLSSAKWSGAGTGALVSGGLAGIAGGSGAVAMGDGAAGSVIALGGLGMFGYGLYRWNRLRKGR